MIDLLVAGGGPAGLATAIFAAQNGMQVVVVEPRLGPIDKACGEGIMPAGRQLLDQMGVVLKTGKSFLGVRYHSGHSVATGRFRHGKGLGIRRSELSTELWERATDLGVERRQGRIREAAQFDDHVVASGIQARWLIAADGLNSTVARSVGIPLLRNPAGRYGVRRHFLVDDAIAFVEVHLGDTGEAYVTPISDTEVGVAILSSEPTKFEEGLAEFSKLQDVLGAPVGNVRGAGPFRQFASRLSTGRVLLVGDAAGFLDPITGEGMRLGFESAQWAVDCIRRNHVDAYDAGWLRIVRKYRWITTALLLLRANRLTKRAIVPTLKTFPAVFDTTLGLLASY